MPDSISQMYRISIFLFAITFSFWLFCKILDISPSNALFWMLERKKTGKFPSQTEKASRARVEETLANTALSAKKKCTLLNNELGIIAGRLSVSREWKDSISAKIDEIMKANGLTMADFL